MKRLGSLRFDGALAQTQRDAVAHALTSAGIAVTSWTQARCVARTYAGLSVPAETAAQAAAAGTGAARYDEPRLLALEITPREAELLPALERALGGPGRPAGIREAAAGQGGLVLECDPEVSLRLVLDLIDLELAPSPGRTIAPLLPLSDACLTAFAAATLGVPDLDANRLIETFSVPLLSGGAA